MSQRSHDVRAFTILATGHLLVFAIFRGILGFNGLYGQDSHEYYRFARCLAQTLPAFPENDPFFWPKGYPLVAGALIRLLGDSPLMLQLVSLVSAMSGSYFLYKLIQPRGTPEPGTRLGFLLLAFIASPAVVIGSVVAMSDMLAIAVMLYAWWQFRKWLDMNSMGSWLGMLMASWAAYEIRNPVAILLVPCYIWACREILRRKAWGCLLAGIGIAGLFAVISLHAKQVYSPYIDNHLWDEWSLANALKRQFVGVEGIQAYKWPNILSALSWMLHPVYFFPGMVLLLGIRKSDLKEPVIQAAGISLLLVTIMVAGLPLQNKRYVLTAFPLYLVILYPAFSRFLKNAKTSIRMLFILGSMFLQAGWSAYNARTYLELNDLEMNLVAGVRERLPQESVLYTFSVEGAFQSYGFPGEVRSLFNADSADFQKGMYLLVPPDEMLSKWSATPVGLSYHALVNSGRLEAMGEIQSGWNLYVIR